MAALLILNYHFQRFTLLLNLPQTPNIYIDPKAVTRNLTPQSTLLRLPSDHYDSYVFFEDWARYAGF